MNFSENKELYLRIKRRKIILAHVAEVGVFRPETSNIYDFIEDGLRTTLVEPDPDCICRIHAKWENYNNVTLVPKAVALSQGKIKLVQRQASTFIADLSESPAIVNDNYQIREEDVFETESILFSAIDDSTIDLLSVDIEGAEWFVFQNLISRPKVISVETHGKYYQNPYTKELRGWFANNKYVLWYKTKSDSVYFKQELLSRTITERLSIYWMNFYLWFRRAKRITKFRISGK